MINDGHICWPPIGGRKTWWTCDCGQLWRRVEGTWRLAPREEQT